MAVMLELGFQAKILALVLKILAILYGGFICCLYPSSSHDVHHIQDTIYTQDKFFANLDLAPAGFEFLNPARSGFCAGFEIVKSATTLVSLRLCFVFKLMFWTT